MSTAQQLGLIGNSVKVQSLPTASAETFGAGNRFYTLIGQQEGYITGHTYHTVVANDVYSWEDVACGNYNMLDNIPVINQDLSASGFTPVANTYYRHTGTTTDTFTQGVIYFYDTEYHKLGESGGGTTLNKHIFTFDLYNATTSNRNILKAILDNAKSITNVSFSGYSYGNGIASVAERGNYIYIVTECIREANFYIRLEHKWQAGQTLKKYDVLIVDTSSGTASVTINVNKDIPSTGCTISLTYWNETEITG